MKANVLFCRACRINLHTQKELLIHGDKKCNLVNYILINSLQKRNLRSVSKIKEVRKVKNDELEHHAKTNASNTINLSNDTCEEINDYKQFKGYKIYNKIFQAKLTENNFDKFRAKKKLNFLSYDDPQKLLLESDLSVAASALIKEKFSNKIQNQQNSINKISENEKVQYPFAIQTKFKKISPINFPTEPVSKNNSVTVTRQNINVLIRRYEEAEKEISPEEEFDMLLIKQALYGTPNPKVPSSDVQCSGCGAFLHCQDPTVPGYIPSQMFEKATKAELRHLVCQRCNLLTKHNVALSVNVSPESYIELLSEIRNKTALVILIVDLTDFPCSIWPGLLDIIGRHKPIYVVGNKVDLIPKDEEGYLNRIKMALEKSLIESNLNIGRNIKHISLISAKTGYGIEDLITNVQTHWKNKGDVYLVGCTNVGKSSLFNCLIQSDFCKVKAVDIVQRATISQWPGTTLNLLKFPILRPSASRLYLRQRRLEGEKSERMQEYEMRRVQFKKTKDRNYATLIGRIGMTFYKPEYLFPRGVLNPFELETNVVPKVSINEGKAFRADASEFRDGKWCYDTPGSIQPDQIINLLTLEEIKMTLPKELIQPKTYTVRPQCTLFIGGLGRIDYIEGVKSLRMTVLASNDLPITILPTEIADEFYKKFLGTDVFKVPIGKENRLKDFPPLEGKEMKIKGIDVEESCADIVLSSAGWVSLTPLEGEECTLKAFTPAGKGLYLREPPLLPFAVRLRGQRIKSSPCYKNDKTLI